MDPVLFQPELPPSWTPGLFPEPPVIPSPPYTPPATIPEAPVSILEPPVFIPEPPVNPTTGRPYKSEADYDEVWKDGSPGVQRKIAEEELRRAQQAREEAMRRPQTDRADIVQQCEIKAAPWKDPERGRSR